MEPPTSAWFAGPAGAEERCAATAVAAYRVVGGVTSVIFAYRSGMLAGQRLAWKASTIELGILPRSETS